MKPEYHVKVKRIVRGVDGTFYVSLPRYWCDAVGLQKNQAIEIEFLSERELVVRVPLA